MPEVTNYHEWAEKTMLELFRGNRREMHGYSPQQIEELMKTQSVSRLPQVFYQLLRVAGEHGLVALFEWDSSCLEYASNLKKRTIRTFTEEERNLMLPDDAFVFFNHQGEQIMYFLTDNDSDDPPVFEYYDDEGIKGIGRFSELVSQWVEEELRGY